MHIGEIAKQSGFSKDTLRYYEKIGLIQLTDVQRGENNYRVYDDTILLELSNIRKLKKVGFALTEIKRLRKMNQLDLINCQHLAPLLQEKLEKIEQAIAQLTTQKNKLLTLKNSCKGECSATLQKL